MNRGRLKGKLWSQIQLLLMAGICFLLTASTTWAADEEPEEKSSGSWGLAYLVIVLALGLAIGAICRPGGRNKEIKIEEDEEDHE